MQVVAGDAARGRPLQEGRRRVERVAAVVAASGEDEEAAGERRGLGAGAGQVFESPVTPGSMSSSAMTDARDAAAQRMSGTPASSSGRSARRTCSAV